MTSYTKYEVIKLSKICKVMRNRNSYANNQAIQNMNSYTKTEVIQIYKVIRT